jgi:hypothetical protein
VIKLGRKPRAVPGRSPDGLVVIEEAKARSECTEERWPIAELLRIKGELLLLQAAPAAAARRQGALSWE